MYNIGIFIGQIHLDSQRKVLLSIFEQCKKNNMNLHVFSFFSSTEMSFNLGEFEYINRINIDKYDGFIFYAETIYNQTIREKMLKKLKSYNKNVVSIDYKIENGINIISDNNLAMQDIMEHLIEEHNVKKINFIAGPKNSTDSKARKKGCDLVCEKYNIKIDDKRVYYGDFFADSGALAIEYYKNNNLLDADAYICANDQMALGAYFELIQQGFKIPKDCIITGFDNITQAEYNIIGITSVERSENKIGELAFNKLIKLINGLKEEDEYVNAVPIFRGSCCKNANKVSNKQIINFYNKHTADNINFLKYSNLINESSSEFTAVNSIEELVNILPKYLKRFKIPELCLCLDKNVDSDIIEIPLHYVINKRKIFHEIIRRDDVIPPLTTIDDSNLTIIMPLHYLNNYYGYIVCNNYTFPLENEIFHTFLNNIANALEAINSYNKMQELVKKLQEASSTDSLTQLLNRNGFFDKADILYEHAKYNRENMFIIYADLDGLKKINDNLGHKYGDIFIKDFANILKKVNKNNDYLTMRFGGDEFVIFGTNFDETKVNEFVDEINKEIKKLNESNSVLYFPYKLSASIGTFIIDPNSNLSLLSLIDNADKKMYIEKQNKKNNNCK